MLGVPEGQLRHSCVGIEQARRGVIEEEQKEEDTGVYRLIGLYKGLGLFSG